MNFRRVFNIVGVVLLVEAATMALPMLVALYYAEPIEPFLYAIAITFAAGLVLRVLPSKKDFRARDGFFTVGLIWVLMGACGALPFFFSHQFGGYVNCLFESISGFSTTGASILEDIEVVSRGLLFWRSETQWLGGMGVLVLAVALVPSLGEGGKYLMRAESPGPVKSKLAAKSTKSSQIMYGLYIIMTVIEIFALRLTGMRWFDCVCNSLTTAATGGFGVLNDSIAGYGNPAAEYIITIFMLLFAVNFAVYFFILTGRAKQALKSDELHFFLLVIAFSTITITTNIYHSHESLEHAFRMAFFQVASVISTTGFATANFDLWPWYSKVMLLILMFCGGCAGSTAGGVKCSRILIIVRQMRREIREIVHPNSVNLVRLDGDVVEEKTIRSTLVFMCSYLAILLIGTLLLSITNEDFITVVSSCLTCISNVGPGLALVCPIYNFDFYPAWAKLLMCLLMIIGRLEIFPVLILFSRSAWRKY